MNYKKISFLAFFLALNGFAAGESTLARGAAQHFDISAAAGSPSVATERAAEKLEFYSIYENKISANEGLDLILDEANEYQSKSVSGSEYDPKSIFMFKLPKSNAFTGSIAIKEVKERDEMKESFSKIRDIFLHYASSSPSEEYNLLIETIKQAKPSGYEKGSNEYNTEFRIEVTPVDAEHIKLSAIFIHPKS